MTLSLDTIPIPARDAWLRLRDALLAILGDDLVSIWAYGSVIGADRPSRPADLDTHVILRRPPDPVTAQAIEDAIDGIGRVEFDVWFIGLEDARRNEQPPHAFKEGRRDTSWAIHRSHWLAGRVVTIHGLEPSDVVTAPAWQDVVGELDRELEHIERHVKEGDTDPYEAAYAILNGSRILRSLETHDAVLSKREAGAWALEQLDDRWQRALRAALRAYDEQSTTEDAQLLAREMAPFTAMVRAELPPADGRSANDPPRWSGY
ncbi:MAG TPA: aminoglycoside adenylyltransferase domain-containing protein [Candidatus Limnocylindria bacterium]